MTSMKEAFLNTKRALVEIFGEEVMDIRLEEVDLSSSQDYWEIVVSFLYPQKNPPTVTALGALAALSDPFNRKYERIYKKVIVQKENGEVTSIKIFKNE